MGVADKMDTVGLSLFVDRPDCLTPIGNTVLPRNLVRLENLSLRDPAGHWYGILYFRLSGDKRYIGVIREIQS